MDNDEKLKIGVISLGCDKNRVDTENMLGHMGDDYIITQSQDDADVIIINTCAFLESAREEAIETILEAKSHNPKKIIVTGCLPQKFADELMGELIEADAFVGTGNYQDIKNIIESVVKSNKQENFVTDNLVSLPSKNRVITTPYHYAYLKIAEGCSNHCTYCLIPSIRGKYNSFDFDSIINEARELVSQGVKELIVVAQDTTKYGDGKIVELLKELSKLDVRLIRLMYAYPEGVSDELIKLIKDTDKIAKYIDIPLQHVNDRILKLMGRRVTKKQISELIKKLDGIDIRSTFILGFPGETQEEFDELLEFLQVNKLSSVGFFAYSREEGTPAYKMANQIDEEVKNERVRIAYETQAKVLDKNKEFIGHTLKVIYEDIDFGENCFIGRLESQAPDVDGVVKMRSEDISLEVGCYYNVLITGFDKYDFIGEVKSEFTK